MSELKKEQLCAISHDTGDMLVSASAGSGKTFVVIRRILRLLSENKTPVTGILAVTFTEAAAKDMKEKLKAALNKRAAEGDSFAEEKTAEISAADVCTLHSFCAKILRLYFFKAGVSPDFAVIDESDADALKKECLDKAFKKFFDDKDQEFLLLVKRHLKNRKSEDLKSLVSYIHGVSQEEADPDLWLNKYETVLSPAGFDNALKEFGDFLQKDVS
ncbi:MAG: UvrD-helicase domain-containing protein, partial [Clostridia bacterium]|nr:UvrD-helicase domain-containing protein [Clostridia bacterium]